MLQVQKDLEKEGGRVAKSRTSKLTKYVYPFFHSINIDLEKI